jgi:predicted TIM-barrel fold metal-dependent hydrolase
MRTYPEWNRNTRKPQVTLPANACDCAVHVYGGPRASPLSPTRAYDPPAAGIDDVRRVHSLLGIERAVIIQPTVYGTDHRVMLDALKRDPDRYRGIALVDDTVSDEQLQALHRAGVRSARFNFLSSLNFQWDPAKINRTFSRIGRLGWAVSVHGTIDELMDRYDLLKGVRHSIIVDHMAHWELSTGTSSRGYDFLRARLQEGNWWIKLSNGDRISRTGAPYEDTVDFVQSLIAIQPDRMIWGTDWPHVLYDGTTPNDADLVELFFRYVPDSSLRQKILVDNPARLFGFVT